MRLAALASLLVLAGLPSSGCGGGKGTTKAKGSGGATSTAPAPPASREVAPGVVRASVGNVTATLHAASHHPRVDRPWPLRFTVSIAGRPARARVRYEYLFAGQVVARRSNYRFTGSFHDTFLWPSSALGYPLTFRAVIDAAGARLNLDYAVQVVGAPAARLNRADAAPGPRPIAARGDRSRAWRA
jgi:hypothetical protein